MDSNLRQPTIDEAADILNRTITRIEYISQRNFMRQHWGDKFADKADAKAGGIGKRK